ncbi:hypothetical protein LY78DRAFT_439967 [Colletotrichum sublineola]|nr:hypothetical protein LY78DRAFT_439967 [Colletotrichum sublineola]
MVYQNDVRFLGSPDHTYKSTRADLYKHVLSLDTLEIISRPSHQRNSVRATSPCASLRCVSRALRRRAHHRLAMTPMPKHSFLALSPDDTRPHLVFLERGGGSVSRLDGFQTIVGARLLEYVRTASSHCREGCWPPHITPQLSKTGRFHPSGCAEWVSGGDEIDNVREPALSPPKGGEDRHTSQVPECPRNAMLHRSHDATRATSSWSRCPIHSRPERRRTQNSLV